MHEWYIIILRFICFILLLSKSCYTLEFKLFELTIFIVVYHITSSCTGTSMTMCIRYTLSVI